MYAALSAAHYHPHIPTATCTLLLVTSARSFEPPQPNKQSDVVPGSCQFSFFRNGVVPK
jgi:hypothetical protein